MNWKGCGSKSSWPDIRYCPGIFDGLMKTTKKVRRFKPKTSRVQGMSANYPAANFVVD